MLVRAAVTSSGQRVAYPRPHLLPIAVPNFGGARLLVRCVNPQRVPSNIMERIVFPPFQLPTGASFLERIDFPLNSHRREDFFYFI